MNVHQFSADTDATVRQYEYDDGLTIVADLGPETTAATDVVDETVIVVCEDDQYELELPAHATEADTFIKNGVLTIETEAQR